MIGVQKKGEINFSVLKRKKRIFLLFISISILVIGFILLFVFVLPVQKVVKVPTCGDGTFYNTCSLDKPYYCDNGGQLMINASVCGCPASLTKQGSSCIINYLANPKSINLSYILDGKKSSFDFVVYKGLVDYLSTLPESIIYTDGQRPIRSDFKLMRLNEPNQEDLIMHLVKDIENIAPDSKTDQARIAISIVQNIPWGSSGKKIKFLNSKVGYSRYPYQVLYDNQGLCGEKSELLADILRGLDYGVALFYYPKENHEALGIKCPVEYSLNGTGYCFVETSGPAIISDNSLRYVGGVTLKSSPELILISKGISLPLGLEEYKDAKTLINFRNRKWLNPISVYRFKKIESKYGLSKVYNIG